MIKNLIKSILEFFFKLPKPIQIQIIDALIVALSYAFRRFFRTKKDEDLKTATNEAVTPRQWQGTSAAVSAMLPSTYSEKKKVKFANSIIDLIKSNEFITELSNRISNVEIDDEEAYVALCSIETKKLIIEMMDK